MRTDRTASGLIAAVWSVSLALGQPQAPNVALGDLVRLALERSPELAGARRAIDVLSSKVSPAGALPDPELMFGQMNEGNLVPFQTLGRRDFSEVYIGFTQEFPFPGKRPLRRKVAELEVQAEESRLQLTRLRITSEVKSAFYDLYSIRKAAGVVSKERDLLDRLARSASRSSSAAGRPRKPCSIP